MSQQALDFRTSIRTVRRKSKTFIAIAVLGLLVGAGYAVVRPPLRSSTALVVLPAIAASANAQAAAEAGITDNEIATQVVVASSYPVLAGALPHISPPVSAQTLQGRVQVQNLTGSSIISISASAPTAAEAEATANAVANSYIAYVTAPDSPAGRVSATMLEPANTATGGNLAAQLAIDGLLGLLSAAIVGFIALLAISTRDRRLVERDAIANSIGAPVLASVPVRNPSDATSWMKLLEEYEPAAVHAWILTKLLQQLGVTPAKGRDGAAAGNGTSLTVLSLASDPRALALGPQVAAFAAAQGIPTALVVGPQQDVNVTATLRTACATPEQTRADQRRPLQLVVAEDDDELSVAMDNPPGWLGAPFVVVVAVVDGQVPLMPHAVSTTSTVLGVTSGAATADQLARAATVAAAHGREVTGIIVANPDPGDQSTGRIPRMVAPLQRPLPTRVNDVPTEIKR
jgi:capsular polysaccharide biosynthesis protein